MPSKPLPGPQEGEMEGQYEEDYNPWVTRFVCVGGFFPFCFHSAPRASPSRSTGTADLQRHGTHPARTPSESLSHPALALSALSCLRVSTLVPGT